MQLGQNAMSATEKTRNPWDALGGFSREMEAEQHRRLAVEFATKLPKDPSRAKAILEDALRFYGAFNDVNASAVSRDFLGKSG